jgi:hypothetical protein
LIDQNELAECIAAHEGKREQVNIAQIKEVLRVTLELLARLPASQVMELVESHLK